MAQKDTGFNRKLNKYTLYGAFLRSYIGTNDPDLQNLNTYQKVHIRRAANHLKTSMGFAWRWDDDKLGKESFPIGKRFVRVIKFNEAGLYLKEFMTRSKAIADANTTQAVFEHMHNGLGYFKSRMGYYYKEYPGDVKVPYLDMEDK
jgi:hypothetical protein